MYSSLAPVVALFDCQFFLLENMLFLVIKYVEGIVPRNVPRATQWQSGGEFPPHSSGVPTSVPILSH